MLGRKSVIGISALFVLAFCAFAATSASATQRAFTCVPGTGYSDEHCVTAVGGGMGSFEHEEIANGSPTSIDLTTAGTASETTAATVTKLKGTISGLETEVQCSGLGFGTSTGMLENTASSAGATGAAEYIGCTVTKPAGKGCVIKGGAITTKVLLGTTEGQETNKVKITPNSGTEFAVTPFEKCSVEALNGEFKVTGSLVATVSGATLTTTHTAITGQNTLKWAGNKAGLESAATMAGAEGGDPIVLE